MKVQINQYSNLFYCLGLFVMFSITGCSATNNHYLIASTGTVIGVEISQNPVNQTPQAKLGYNRAEIAIVPTNRNPCVINETTVSGGKTKKKIDCGPSSGKGAADTAEVLMELRYSGIFSWGENSGIYQRLAVGKIAVIQPGAAVMFAKKADGSIDSNAASTINAVKVQIEKEDQYIKTIVSCVSTNAGNIDKNALTKLITTAKITGTPANYLKAQTTAKKLRIALSEDVDSAILPLYKNLPNECLMST